METNSSRLWPCGIAVVVAALVSAACVPGRRATTVEQPEDVSDVGAPGLSGGEFTVAMINPTVLCDGTEQPVATIRGAQPLENLIVELPAGAPEVAAASADAKGEYSLQWTCAPTEAGTEWTATVTGESSRRTAAIAFAAADDTAPPLSISGLREDIFCDNKTYDLVTLSDAVPNEPVSFTSPQKASIQSELADEAGLVRMRWTCDEDEIGTTWEITAFGDVSGSAIDFSFTGVAPTPGSESGLVATLIEDPFVCDGGARPVATLSGFQALEVINFSSPEVSGSLRPGEADDNGDLQARWQCDADQAGTIWQVTATGRTSGRSVTLTITGGDSTDAVPDGSTEPPAAVEPTIELTENPFTCDGTTRGFGTIANLAPNEIVEFASPQSPNLKPGTADEEGRLAVRWSCGIDDSTTTWEITATGTTSQRSITFSLAGAAPPG